MPGIAGSGGSVLGMTNGSDEIGVLGGAVSFGGSTAGGGGGGAVSTAGHSGTTGTGVGNGARAGGSASDDELEPAPIESRPSPATAIATSAASAAIATIRATSRGVTMGAPPTRADRSAPFATIIRAGGAASPSPTNDRGVPATHVVVPDEGSD